MVNYGKRFNVLNETVAGLIGRPITVKQQMAAHNKVNPCASMARRVIFAFT